MTDPHPFRVIGVRPDQWARFRWALAQASIALRQIPPGPNHERYELADTKERRHASEELLTERETQVLAGISQGLMGHEIDAALCLIRNTVKSHMAALYRKLGARDRGSAVAIAFRKGLLS